MTWFLIIAALVIWGPYTFKLIRAALRGEIDWTQAGLLMAFACTCLLGLYLHNIPVFFSAYVIMALAVWQDKRQHV